MHRQTAQRPANGPLPFLLISSFAFHLLASPRTLTLHHHPLYRRIFRHRPDTPLANSATRPITTPTHQHNRNSHSTMGSVWLAIIYIGGWILSMRVFGYFWKNRKLGEFAPPSLCRSSLDCRIVIHRSMTHLSFSRQDTHFLKDIRKPFQELRVQEIFHLIALGLLFFHL